MKLKVTRSLLESENVPVVNFCVIQFSKPLSQCPQSEFNLFLCFSLLGFKVHFELAINFWLFQNRHPLKKQFCSTLDNSGNKTKINCLLNLSYDRIFEYLPLRSCIHIQHKLQIQWISSARQTPSVTGNQTQCEVNTSQSLLNYSIKSKAI